MEQTTEQVAATTEEQVATTGQTQSTPTPSAPPTPTPSTPPRFEDQQEKVFKFGQKEAWSLIDDQIEKYGFKRPENVKTSEFVNQVLEKLTKEQTSAPAQSSEEDNLIKDKYKALKAEYDNLNTKFSTQIKDFEQKQADIAINTTIENLPISVPPGLPEEAATSHQQIIREAIQAKFKNTFEVRKGENGEQIYYDKEKGMPVLNPTGSYATAKEAISKYFPQYFVKYDIPNQNKPGVRTPDSNTSTQDGKFKSLAEIHAHLAKSKPELRMGTQEYLNEAFRLKKDSGI